MAVALTMTLDGTRVKFADSVTDANGDGNVDFSDVQSTDVVVLKVFGHHHRHFGDHTTRAHRSCNDGTLPNDTKDRTAKTIKFAFVFRPPST